MQAASAGLQIELEEDVDCLEFIQEASKLGQNL